MKLELGAGAKTRRALADLDLQPVARITLDEQVYQELRRLIMAGSLRPGQTVSIRAVAGLINVSPMPVRSALQRLATEWALDLRPNRTFALPVLTAEEFTEIADVRARLEGLAAERAAGALGRIEIDSLNRINRKMFRGTKRDPEFLELNRQFHFLIYEAARMPRLLHLIEMLWLQIGPLLNLVTSRAETRISRQTHDAIVKALAAGNGPAARAAVQKDIYDAARFISAWIRAESRS
jgi:DNA-binding GntR family transcriptional regulator